MPSLRYCILRRIKFYSFNSYNCIIKRSYCSAKESNNQKQFEDISVDRIRNFSIVAHVDHGKSTLADRFLEITGAIKAGESKAQVLDQLQVERERGITVKAVSTSLNYTYKGKQYLLNLIDTPGHVDFSNEVVRSVQACQGAILLVDANEGPQAQTVAVYSLAARLGLAIVPVLNKIDLPHADPERSKKQLKTLFKIEPSDVLEVSAKKGWGVKEVLDAIIERVPPPTIDTDDHLKALVFDSWYDKFRGIMCLSYIQSGCLNMGDSVRWYSSGKPLSVKYLSLLTPEERPIQKAIAGQVAVIGCGPRGGGAVGDLLLSASVPFDPIAEKSAKISGPRHMVYAGLYPVDQSQHGNLQSALTKLCMNDPAVSIAVDSSPALGQGWRVGFLGLLHLEVFTQRLFQEHKAEAILTAPSVPYKIKIHGTKMIKSYGSDIITITNPAQLPCSQNIVEFYEPFVIGTIITPSDYIGTVTSLCMERRATTMPTLPVDDNHVMMQFRLPLCEVVLDFHDVLKSITSGYASFDYHEDGFDLSPLVKLEIHLNGVLVDELSNIVHVSRANTTGRRLVDKLKEMIPRQMVTIAIQAVVKGKVVARQNLQAYKKDVTAKLYGGDVTRRMKLLKQQAEGKKKMRSIANIKIPRDTFIDVLKK